MSDLLQRLAKLSPQKLALLAAQLQTRLETLERSRSEPIAIVGIGCRYPGGIDGPASFWELLRRGGDAISEVPSHRWDIDAFFDADPDAPGKMTTRWGGFLDGVDKFDARFFGISPKEASRLDPQQRLILEVAWEALERAGQSREKFGGSATGVFVGVYGHEYSSLHANALNSVDPYTGPGTALNVVAGRLAYLLDLKGPALVVDTACSSSLVAVHLACQSLRHGECSMAIAGGVNVMLTPMSLVPSSKMGMLAADGRCKSFDARADGVVISEGCGLVVLKPLSKAQADGDPILALIRGAAINQDGRSNGLTAPNVLSQQAVIKQALSQTGIDAGRVTHIEAHGTGTSLGDPIEFEALRAVYGQGEPVALGTVKANLGHAGAAAGVAGLIKLVLSLEHHEIPPHPNLQQLSPNISLDGTQFSIPTTTQPWPRGDKPRFGALSSFGWSGTNVHMLLEEAPLPASPTTESKGPYILPLSARSPDALRDVAARYRAYLNESTATLTEVCFTAGARRTHFEHRVAFVADDKAELLAHLDTISPPEMPVKRQPLAFVFSGQGSLWAGMAQQLLSEDALFRETIGACDAGLRRHTDWSLLAELERGDADRFRRTDIAQPLLFAVQVALATRWRAWGIAPDALVGHSVGEIAAAHLAGVLDLDTALHLVWQRGALMQRTAGQGAMVSAQLTEADAHALIAEAGYSGQVAVAAHNSPQDTVLSGDTAAITALTEMLAQQGITTRRLDVDFAFHSPQMTPLASELETALAGLSPQPPQIPIWSTVTGARQRDFTATYWGRNLADPVRFSAAIESLANFGIRLFLEIGPHPVLARPVLHTLAAHAVEGQAIASLRRGQPGPRMLAQAAATLYTAGQPLDWARLYAGGTHRPDAPTYPWQHQRYWINIEPPHPREMQAPLPGHQLATAGRDTIYEFELNLQRYPFLSDHRYFGRVVVPGALFLATALAAPEISALEDVVFTQPLTLNDDESRTVQLVLSDDRFTVASLTASGWHEHASGTFITTPAETPAPVEINALLAQCSEALSMPDYHARLRAGGLDLGTHYHVLESFRRGEREAIARLNMPSAHRNGEPNAPVHPLLLDASLQLIGAALPGEQAAMPLHFERIEAFPGAGPPVWSYVRLREDESQRGDFQLLNASGQPVMKLVGLRVQAVSETQLGTSHALFTLTQRPEPPATPTPATPGRWLVFTDNAVVAAIAEALQAQQQDIITVQPGSDYRQLSPTAYELNPLNPAQVARLRQESGDVQGMLYGLTTPKIGGGGLLHLVKMWHDQPVPIWLVTQHNHPEQSPLAGLGAVLALEHPDLWGGHITVDDSCDAAAIAADLLTPTGEDHLAWINGRRHVTRLTPVPTTSRPAFKWQGTYLITGGLGGLGFHVAKWLVAEKGLRHLMLMSRRPPSPERAAAIDQLRQQGAHIVIAEADVADFDALQAALKPARAELPPLTGVIHAAGVIDDGVLTQLDWPRFEKVLAPKVQGAWNLHRATQDDSLQAFVLFSSLASALGATAQGNYAAGNAYLDALAHHRRANGLPATSINWAPWADIGMAAHVSESGQRRLEAQGLIPLSPAAGLEMLDRALALDAAQVLVIPTPWLDKQTSQDKSLLRDLHRDRSAPSQAEAPTPFRSQWDAAAPDRREPLLRDEVRRQVIIAMGLNPAERIPPRQPLADLGLDSLTAVELRNALGASLNHRLPATLFFDYPTIDAVVGFLIELLQPKAAPAAVTHDDTATDLQDILAELDNLSDDAIKQALKGA